jgi:hypothetical protein
MFITLKIIALISYIGYVSFNVRSMINTKKLKLYSIVQWLSGLFIALFISYFLSDFSLLQINLSIFDSSFEIVAIEVISAFVIISFRKKTYDKTFIWSLCIVDSVVITRFTVIGYHYSTYYFISYTMCKFNEPSLGI